MLRLCLLLLTAAWAVPRAEESQGVVSNSCHFGTYALDFRLLPELCEVGSCPAALDTDIVVGPSTLRAPGGILDLGPLTGDFFNLGVTVPTEGYTDSAAFHLKRLYALKLKRGGHALFAETRGFVGGCLHYNFGWRVNEYGPTFDPDVSALRPHAGKVPAAGTWGRVDAARPSHSADGRRLKPDRPGVLPFYPRQ